MSEEQLTERQASVCLEIVKGWIARTDPSAVDHIQLHEPGFHCDGWAIALEGDPEEWPWHISQDAVVSWPDGVFAEAGSDWYLSLYPA